MALRSAKEVMRLREIIGSLPFSELARVLSQEQELSDIPSLAQTEIDSANRLERHKACHVYREVSKIDHGRHWERKAIVNLYVQGVEMPVFQ